MIHETQKKHNTDWIGSIFSDERLMWSLLVVHVRLHLICEPVIDALIKDEAVAVIAIAVIDIAVIEIAVVEAAVVAMRMTADHDRHVVVQEAVVEMKDEKLIVQSVR